jgi:membrane associated rhomboid family serine protease
LDAAFFCYLWGKARREGAKLSNFPQKQLPAMPFPMYWMLIGIILAVSYAAFNNRIFLARMVHNPFLVAQSGQYYRLLSSGFVHLDWTHLLFNLISFYFFAPHIETVLGPWALLLLFLGAVAVSSLPAQLRYREQPGYSSLGASGGVSAVIFASILYYPQMDMLIFPIPIPIKAYILGPLYLIYSYYQGKRAADNINHNAHLVGALCGLAFAYVADPERAGRFWENVMENPVFG